MLYVLADWVNSEEGIHPSLPEECSFLCLAGTSKRHAFGLFEICDFPEDCYRQLASNAVPKPLAVALASCKAYPPALAKAARAIERLKDCSREEFIMELGAQIRKELEQQRHRPYVLARSRVTEPGYREVGEFVWVVAYRPEFAGREVAWVSSDYQIYSDAVGTFDLEPTWLAARFHQGVF